MAEILIVLLKAIKLPRLLNLTLQKLFPKSRSPTANEFKSFLFLFYYFQSLRVSIKLKNFLLFSVLKLLFSDYPKLGKIDSPGIDAQTEIDSNDRHKNLSIEDSRSCVTKNGGSEKVPGIAVFSENFKNSFSPMSSQNPSSIPV
ncbi:hypothetical protein AVEN_228906-1 [Araneus ventricosus]|uniref:Uncharacterized protein n=1 Tax=Araneus ventricosus TaxID=182803 RepID=A0A4Y2TP52_ARAVE|nr:hypothetical protein AVEN_228906-1 [Araneus ventricosus]